MISVRIEVGAPREVVLFFLPDMPSIQNVAICLGTGFVMVCQSNLRVMSNSVIMIAMITHDCVPNFLQVLRV